MRRSRPSHDATWPRWLQEEYTALKPSLPAGQLPVLEVDGKVFPQSRAIYQYVARKAALYPIDTIQAFYVDVVVEVGAPVGLFASLEPCDGGPRTRGAGDRCAAAVFAIVP